MTIVVGDIVRQTTPANWGSAFEDTGKVTAFGHFTGRGLKWDQEHVYELIKTEHWDKWKGAFEADIAVCYKGSTLVDMCIRVPVAWLEKV